MLKIKQCDAVKDPGVWCNTFIGSLVSLSWHAMLLVLKMLNLLGSQGMSLCS